MARISVSCALACALLASASARPCRAEDGPTNRKPVGNNAATRTLAIEPAGDQGLRPFLGVAGHLDVDVATPAGGNKILFGLDYLMGGPTGFAIAAGMHLGAGGRAFLLYPVLELHYRFDLPIPLIPWVGVGAGVRIAFARGQDANIGLGFRFIAGAEYYLSPNIAISTQAALPDIGPRLVPDTRVIGTLEWTIGPAFHF